MPSKKTFRIGCSGYYYPVWKNIFYPKEIPPREWLTYYAGVFNTVELNGTFYKVPKLNDLKKYAERTPKHFRFSVKMNKFITHNKKLKDCKDEVAKFQDLIYDGLGRKLSCTLFQMPPSFHYNEENLARVLNCLPHNPHSVVEFRHISWWTEDVFKALKKARITFCNVDFPGMDTFVVPTTPLFYFRFHGNPILFASKYSTSTLKKYLSQFPEKGKELYVFFNNTGVHSALDNAREFQQLILKNA